MGEETGGVWRGPFWTPLCSLSSVKAHTAGKMKQHVGNASAQRSPLGPQPGFLLGAGYLGSVCQGVSRFPTPEGKQVLSISHSLHGIDTVSPPYQLTVNWGDTLNTKFQVTSLRPAMLTPRYTDDKPFKFIEWCASILSQHFSYGSLHVFVQIL